MVELGLEMNGATSCCSGGKGGAVAIYYGSELLMALVILINVRVVRCVDKWNSGWARQILKAASKESETVLHYEFMQDYKVHLDGHIEEVPYFCLPANELVDVIAPSCYSCFDDTNALVDLVVGYMGVPKYFGLKMTEHPQYITVRNERGRPGLV